MKKWIFSFITLIALEATAEDSFSYINKYTELNQSVLGYNPDERFIKPIEQPKIRFSCPITEQAGLFYFFTPDIALSTQPVKYKESHIDDSLRFGMLISVSLALY